jgi:hypothetical protein
MEKGFDVMKGGIVLIPIQAVEDLYSGTHPGGYLFSFLADFLGPFMGNFHKNVQDIKYEFDPKQVANPPWPIAFYGKGWRGQINKFKNYYKMVLRGGV